MDIRSALPPMAAPHPAKAAPPPQVAVPEFEDIFKGSKPKFGRPFEKYVAATQVPHPVAATAYYDEAADKKQIETYYAGVAAIADPAERMAQLRSLVSRTHKQDSPGYNYTVTKYLYSDVDRRPDGTVRSIYSQEPVQVLTYPDVSLETLSQKDISQIAAAATVAPEILGAWMCFQRGAAALNCEHVVPQSFFNEKQPMRSDLHHLFACESEENNRRGSTPYGEYVPAGGKGEVARATLYFMLRYPSVKLPYDAKKVEMLKQWAADDPPGLHELHRNRQIEKIQGNRNPFIDHPEWLADFKPK